MPTLRGIDDRPLTLRAWLHERVGVLLRKLRIRADPVELPPPPQLELMLAARSAGKVQATLHVDADYVFPSYAARKALYTDYLTGFLVPRTTVWSGEELMIEVNSLGCKGPELEPGRPVVAFFGDSTTMGITGGASGHPADSWPERVELPGYAILNTGVEGLELATVQKRYASLRPRIPLACAVFYTGWHNLIYNRRKPEHWEEQLQGLLSPDHLSVFVNLATSLHPEMRTRGVAPLVNEDPATDIDDDFFHFWGVFDPDRWLLELMDAVGHFNAHLADFCARTGAPLIDLNAFMRPASYEDAPRDFFDVCHFRPHAYPKVAEFVGAHLRELLPEAGDAVVVSAAAVDRGSSAEPDEDLRKNIYPLW